MGGAGNHYNQVRSASNFITITFDSGAPRIANGLHRSSVIYAMYKHNLLDDPFISVKVANDSTDIESSSLEMLAIRKQ